MPEARGSSSRNTGNMEENDVEKKMTVHQTSYGAINGDIMGDTCPTCHGIGRIPRGHQDQLVAVISCSDQRLKPRHTKLYVFISVALSLFFCFLILFFLFPRSITILPVSVKSVMVFFTPNTVEMQVTNVLNISNDNFLEVKILDFDVQVLINKMIQGRIKISNMTSLKPSSQRAYTITVPVMLDDAGMNNFCKSSSIKIHTLFLHLQMTMNVSYLAHSEQLSRDTFEYVDCGANTTTPHPIMS
ncbi:transmembrane protein 106A isoform X1 [Hypomesus transpacificus]|uniref:transmembrane protein 106A isoform X1 n=2 Tax=Hypomesus transpacificus TaxID=137520 RepID=UPI001F0786F8|nr:transmembrane protein 106A isoform X1 [Hypomesus transpacificus]